MPRLNLLTGDAITHLPPFDVRRQRQIIACNKINVMLVLYGVNSLYLDFWIWLRQRVKKRRRTIQHNFQISLRNSAKMRSSLFTLNLNTISFNLQYMRELGKYI